MSAGIIAASFSVLRFKNKQKKNNKSFEEQAKYVKQIIKL